jgi:Pyruvate phosphate dikinase, AMP/ATP-binding domain
MPDIDTIQHRFDTYRELMGHRIREILLVASVYDAYVLEEDGSLEERIWRQYVDRGLSTVPRIRKAFTTERALDLIRNEQIDLVLAVTREEHEMIFDLAGKVKTIREELPVALLAMDSSDLSSLSPAAGDTCVDQVFLWQNDPTLLVAIVKYFEDLANVDHDTREGGVRVVLLVEDNITHFSTVLPAIYTATMNMTRRLIDEGLNHLHKQLRMCSRAKILMTDSYEGAVDIFNRYRPYILGVITDVHFLNKQRLDHDAGFELVRTLRKQEPELPICIQSMEIHANKDRAGEMGTFFIDKNSSRLTEDLQLFLRDYMGFGDFIFRMPDGREIARAGNPRELLDRLPDVPVESIIHHAGKQHFSHWMMARTELQIAEQLYPKRVEDFDDPEAARTYLIQVIKEVLYEKQSDIITHYSPSRNPYEVEFMRQGDGMLGGKARGIGFLRFLLSRLEIKRLFSEITIRMPPTLVICSNEFSRFMGDNALWDISLQGAAGYETLQEKFLGGQVRDDLVEVLRSYLQTVKQPLAVRSSSLMEDSHHLPLAGLYETIMLPNNEDSLEERLESLLAALKLVWVSTFGGNTKVFFKHTGHRQSDERMAVVIQTMSGRQRGKYFYPTFSGVAQSHNYYPISYMKPGDGVTQLALGLGKTVVEGGAVVRFCPTYPLLQPQFAQTRDWLYHTQKQFYALDMTPIEGPRTPENMQRLRQLPLEEAEKHRALQKVASVYQAESGLMVDSFIYEGPRIVTFQKVLRNPWLKLGELLSNLLQVCEKAMRTPVELEFACDLGDDNSAIFYPLQLRPMAAQQRWKKVDITKQQQAQAFCYSKHAHGNGHYAGIHDVVYVKPEAFDRSKTRQIASEIGQFNKRLEAEERPYLLIGFGRWGTVDPEMGIGVGWDQISNVKVLVEMGLKNFNVDLAQGTHFFQNVTSLNVGCLAIPYGTEGFLKWEMIESGDTIFETDHLAHVRWDAPLDIRLDGRNGEAVVLLPDQGTGEQPSDNAGL